VRLDVAAKYRLWTHDGGTPAFLYGNLETNLIRRAPNRVDGQVNEQSGGTTWFGAPGLQYVTRRLVVEGAVQLPLIQNLGATVLEEQFITTVSLRVNL
jgi:hypothetical protein